MLPGVLGVLVIGAGIASGSPAGGHPVHALASSPAAAVTFPSTTTSTSSTTTAPPATVAPAPVDAAAAPLAPAPVADAPAPPTPEEIAIVAQLVAAANPAPEVAEEPEAPAPSGGSVEDAIAASFGDRYDKAIRVARCESSLNPDAVSRGGGNYGLFQINRVHQGMVESMGYSWDQILDPYVNAAVARNIFDSAGGWGPWGCRGA